MYPTRVMGPEGVEYTARAYGEERNDGEWVGWLEFNSIDGRRTLATDAETTQPNRQAVAYWASGIEPIYLEGAYERASRKSGST